MKNRFHALQNLVEEVVDTGTEINRRWKRMASVYKESSEECLGFRQRGKRKEWMTADTWKAIDNRRTLFKKRRSSLIPSQKNSVSVTSNNTVRQTNRFNA